MHFEVADLRGKEPHVDAVIFVLKRGCDEPSQPTHQCANNCTSVKSHSYHKISFTKATLATILVDGVLGR